MQSASSKLLLVLVRHAEREYLNGVPDREQALSYKGQHSCHALGPKLQKQITSEVSSENPVSVIFTSPFRRCQQTAALLTAYLQPRAGMHPVDALAVGQDESGQAAVRWTLNLLASNLETGCIVLVGHQPELLAISRSLGETALALKNCEAAGLELEAKAGLWQVGTARLLWRIRG